MRVARFQINEPAVLDPEVPVVQAAVALVLVLVGHVL
jgi:hypothetical protein